MARFITFALLLGLLAGCSSTPGSSPYGSPDEQRQRRDKADQQLGGY